MKKPQKALHLCLDEDKAKPKHIGETYAVMEKYDGWYMFIDCIDGQWQSITSRNMRILPSMSEYTKMFREDIPPLKVDCRLIFEAIALDENNEPVEFKTINGWFNRNAPIHTSVTLMCHDLVIFGSEERGFKQRYVNLCAVVRKAQESDLGVSTVVRAVPILSITDNKEHWNWHFEQVCRKYGGSGEGVILKKCNAPYTYGKKNADVLKIKCENSFELLVVGMLEGEGKYEGTLGKLIVEDANGIRNNVSGMSDAERILWWNNPSEIKGKIVQVDCMKVLSNKSLREGRFKAIRHDKTEVDKL